MFDSFYILVLDEIQLQPNLKNELECLESVLDIAGEGLDVLEKIIAQGNWQQKFAAAGVKLLRNIGLVFDF